MTEQKDDEDYAQILKRQCVINLFLQSKSARVYNLIQTCLTIPNIIIGGVMSVSIFSTSSQYWRITTGALAIASTILTSVSKQLGAGERAQLHCAMVRQYNSLIQDLNMIIHMNQSVDAAEKKVLIERVRQHLNRLFDMQPEPSYFAITSYENRYKKKLEEALFEDFETAALQHAAFVEMRLSRSKPAAT